jgi:hypothetical protein
MFATCANPGCGTSFDYEHGRFFRFRWEPSRSGAPANTHSVRHFWLCQDCVKSYTLENRNGSGVLLTHRSGQQLEMAIA